VFPTFYEAFKKLYKMIRKAVKEGYSWQMLETSNFIEVRHKSIAIPTAIFSWYHARDAAYYLGIMKAQVLVPFKSLVGNPEEVFKMALVKLIAVETKLFQKTQELINKENPEWAEPCEKEIQKFLKAKENPLPGIAKEMGLDKATFKELFPEMNYLNMAAVGLISAHEAGLRAVTLTELLKKHYEKAQKETVIK
jgi:hypothetical protein